MSKRVETIDISESAQAAARKMRDKKISSIVVVDKRKKEDEPIGIVTERDLGCRICAEGTSSKDAKVQDIMCSPIATIDPRSTVEGAADLTLSNSEASARGQRGQDAGRNSCPDRPE